MKLKHRCKAEGCNKLAKVVYDKSLYLCKKHNPTNKANKGKDVEIKMKNGINIIFTDSDKEGAK